MCEFYKFADVKGLDRCASLSRPSREIRRHTGFLAHTDASGGKVEVPSPMPRKHKSLVKFLTTSEIKALLHSVAHQPHHQMIIRLALQTGLRREELATFPLAYVVNPRRSGATEQNIRVTLDPHDGTGMRTKGDKARVIYMSTRFMSELHNYTVHWRGERASLSDVPSGICFSTSEARPVCRR